MILRRVILLTILVMVALLALGVLANGQVPG